MAEVSDPDDDRQRAEVPAATGAGPGTSRRAVLAGGLAGAGVAAAVGLALGRDGETERPAPLPAGTPPGGWRDASRDHGARGTGEGDDRAALQDAIDGAASGGTGRARGGVVHLGPGVYPISGSLHLRTGVTLWGAGPATVIRLLPGPDEPAIVIESDADGTPVSYAAVRSLTLDGSTGDQSKGRHGIAIRSDNSGSRTPYTGSDSFPLVADVWVVYFGGHGLAIGVDPEGGTANVRGARGDRVTVFECAKAAEGGDRAGIFVAGSDGSFVACDVAGCGGPGFDVVRANNRFDGCKAYFNRTEFRITGSRNQLANCQAQDGFGDGFVLGDGGEPVRGLSLAGCQADSNAGAGFRLDSVEASSLSGLTSFVREGVEPGGPGVVMAGTSRCLVSGTVDGFPTAVEGRNADGTTHLVT
ncbi:MAG TPA: glycosyl hydrolase family 28-related protein [Acidimicrobiales bacterium]|nr:glycosyl hydrolase family 28-related protein [Acidimicrobiales bacterium]